MQIFTDSVSICMSRIRPNSTTFIPSSGSITSRSESLMSVLRESSVCCISVVDVMGLRCDDEYRLFSMMVLSISGRENDVKGEMIMVI